MNLPKVIIIGSHHHNTLGVIRSLGRMGITPFVIMTKVVKDSYILRSKYLAGHVQLDGSDKVIPYILQHCVDNSNKPVLIACHDRISEILDFNRISLSEHFFVPGTSNQGLSKLVNKQIMTELAASVGLNIPSSFVSNSILDLSDLPFPVITKPAASKNGTKHDIRIFYSPDSLSTFLKENSERTFQVQQYVDKDFEFQLIGCSVDGGSRIIIPGISRLIRTSSGSNTGFLKYSELTPDFDDTVSLTKSFIKATGYSGLFSVEFLRGKDGSDYFMEMNFRNDGNAICTTNAGANLPYYWVMSCIGQSPETPIINHTEYVMPEYNEISMWLGGVLSTRDLREDFHRVTSFMEYASDDPEPTHGHRDFRISLIKATILRPIYNIAKRFR